MKLTAYWELTKPRLTFMALVTAMTAFYLAWPKAAIDWILLMRTMMGTALVGGGANAFNQYLERTEDSKMARTQHRPLVSGALNPLHALAFSGSLSVAGVLYLFLKVGGLAAIMGFLVLVSYLLIYTPLKKKTTLNTYAGAVSGALPVFLGWSAALNSLNWSAVSFFAILFMWQLPHFFAISWVYREDYRRGGFCMLAAVDPSGKKVCAHLCMTAVLLFLTSFTPTLTGLAGSLYFSAAVISGLFFLAFALYTGTHKMQYAKELGAASIIYLCTLNIFLIFDKI